MPNSVLSKQKETTGSADTQCCSVLKQTCGLFGKPVINWQHYLQIQILAQKITSRQTWVLMYISKFNLLNESWWKKGIYFLLLPISLSLSQVSTTYSLSFEHQTLPLLYFCFHILSFFFFFFWETMCWSSARKIFKSRTFGNIPLPLL